MTAWVKDSPGFSNGKTATVNFDEVRDTHFILAFLASNQTGIPVFPEYNTVINYSGSNLVTSIELTSISDGTVFGYFIYYSGTTITHMDLWYQDGGGWVKIPNGRFTITYNGSGLPTAITNTAIP